MELRQISLQHLPNPAELTELAAISPQLLLVFGSPRFFEQAALPESLAPVGANIVIGCSSAGEISSHGVGNKSLVLSALHFDDTRLCSVSEVIAGIPDSHAAGARLAGQLPQEGLRHVLLLGPGLDLNGSAVVAGMQSVLPAGVQISGGLAGDDGAFATTYTLGAAGLASNRLVALGLYGERIGISCGSFHGWVPFGPLRKVTRSSGNILYELDGEPALDVYKRYLGDYAKDLPASGLLFPFEMLRADQQNVGLIRTILQVDDAAGSLTLAGDVVEDGYLRLMHATTDSLVDGAEQAAERVLAGVPANNSLSLLVSCVGRKLVMGARVDEEAEAVADMLGQLALPAGFYSYGEIGPGIDTGDCRLHNQTMTITALFEHPAA
ncbi:FIST signal transduction protein [Chitinimonas sp.]|uniref:FIST signal transduction protein n=1 Tax=Chitinimonas sp. TaxID=1934313 RepID=UPI0035B2D61B